MNLKCKCTHKDYKMVGVSTIHNRCKFKCGKYKKWFIAKVTNEGIYKYTPSLELSEDLKCIIKTNDNSFLKCEFLDL